jgi:glycosyltransferase involved in cell wall biosynthesis
LGALVFVTTELSPFTAGGVGRVVHNTLKSMLPEDQRRAYVLALDCNINKAGFEAVFPGVRLISISSDDETGRYDARGHQPPRRAFSDTDFHWKSSRVFCALRTLSCAVEIDYVEFPDWGALGFATIQEKRISGFLGSATLAVRLHTAHAMLLHHEAQTTTVKDSDRAIVDLERKTLRDCDLLIAQLATVGEHTRQVFGFDRSEWDTRLVVHAPPVLLDTCSTKAETLAATPDMPIMFGSKIQAFKRPDLFIRGVSGYCRGNPQYTGDVLVSAHSFDHVYREFVVGLIAPDLVGRFNFDVPMISAARERLIATSTFVVPSDFESFCLAAYEASLLGARVILNGTNPAFGDDTPWRDGVNCYKFDGTSLGLQKALERSFNDGDDLRPAAIPSDPWPWKAQNPPAKFSATNGNPLVSVIIPHFNLGQHLPSTLVSVLEQTYENIEIVLVDDCSTDERSRSLIDDLRSRDRVGLKVIALLGNVGLAASRNCAIAHAAGEYILPLDADDLLHRRFLEVAVLALQRNPDFDVFVTPAAFFHDGKSVILPGENADFPDYAVFVGEALVSGVRENRFSTATALFRANVLREYGYVESLRCYEDWNLYLRLAQDRRRFLVANDVYFYYRNRPASMFKEAQRPGRHLLFMHDNLRTAVSIARLTSLAYLAFLPPEGLPERPAEQPMDRKLKARAASRVKRFARQLRQKFFFHPIHAVIAPSHLFDRNWYLRTNADVANAGIDPIKHYIKYGAAEGRDPGPLFSTRGYLAANPDVDAAGVNPLFHYLQFGQKEGRRAHP